MNFFNVGVILAILVIAVRLIINPWSRESGWGFVAIIWLVSVLFIHNSKRGGKQ